MKKIIILSIFLLSNKCFAQSEISDCNGIILNINGNNRCIDTTQVFYPVLISWETDNLDHIYNKHRSIILKILNEKKWYEEHINSNQIRILIIENNLPTFDSVKLYTFFDIEKDTVILTRKSMHTYDYPDLWGTCDTISHGATIATPNNDSKYNSLLPIDTVNYCTVTYFLNRKEFSLIFKHLRKIKFCHTFESYSIPPELFIETFINGEYQLLISGPVEYLNKKQYCTKNVLGIMRWLNKY